ncbi:MAG TPA: hypothetical protein VII47_01070, partial [Actinomycetota bacterium]
MSPVSSRLHRLASRLGRAIFTIAGLGLAGLTLACAGSTRSGAGAGGASPSPTAISLADRWKVSADSAGPVRVGMTLDEAARAAHSTVHQEGPPSEPGGCTYVSIVGGPEGLAFMVGGDRIARVDVHNGSVVRTVEGAGIGTTEAKVKSLYPGVRVEPAKYLEGGHDLIHTA